MTGVMQMMVAQAPKPGTPNVSGISGATGTNTGAPQSTTLVVAANGDCNSNYGDGAGGTATDSGSWLSPKVGMGRFSCRVTATAGTLDIGTSGVWQDMSVNRTFGVTDGAVGGGAKSATVTLEIARTADTATVLATKTGIVLSAAAL